VRENVPMEEAKRLLHQHRIEKLVVVDEGYRCVGLITVKDIEKAQKYPNACKDERGRLRVAAATSVGAEGLERAMTLLAAECDVIVVDTAHGHSKGVLETVTRIKRESNYAHRCRRRRDQGRDRPRFDLHHAHCRGCGSATADCNHGCG
jgi:IMP dehydrogenase